MLVCIYVSSLLKDELSCIGSFLIESFLCGVCFSVFLCKVSIVYFSSVERSSVF